MRGRTYRATTAVALAAVLVLVLSGCGQAGQAPKPGAAQPAGPGTAQGTPPAGQSPAPAKPSGPPTKVKVTTPVVSLLASHLFVAEKQGFFKDQNLDVEIVITRGSGPDVQAVLSGDAEFTFTSAPLLLQSLDKGQEIVPVFMGLNRLIINYVIHKDVAQRLGITEKTPLKEKWQKVRGLKIGVTRAGALTWDVTNYFLKKNGLDPKKDVEVVAVGADAVMIAALEQKKVDIICQTSPVPETAISKGIGISFLNNATGEDPDVGEFAQIMLMGKPDWIAKNPDVTRRMVAALMKANQWLLDHKPEEVIAVLKDKFPDIDPATLGAAVKSVQAAIPRDGRVTEKSIKVVEDIMREAGLISKPVEYQKLIITDYLPR